MEFFGQNAHFRFLGELNLFGCTQLSYFAVDVNGTLEGYVDEDEPTKFYPIPMMKNSFYAMYQYATDTTIQKLMLDFNQKRNFDESQIYYLTSSDLGYPATDLTGLIPCVITVDDTSITTTGVTVEVNRPTQSAVTNKPLVGLVAGDFTVTNQGDGSNVPVLTCTETADGVYDITYAAVVGTSTFEISAVKAGFDILADTYTDPA
jgi:hypothetical protein